MQSSTNRILTTHAGSLPRPRSLVSLHKAKFEGTAVADTILMQAIEEATRNILNKQLEVGIDIGNNGEMGRESFFTYLQHRMTGFGGTGTRPIMADLLRYPGSLERRRQAMGTDDRVDLLRAPKAIGEVRYVNSDPIEQECAQLKTLLAETTGGFSQAFMSSPSPGIIAAGMQNDYYDDLEAYVNAIAEALQTEYQAITAAGFILQIDAPDLALERHTLFQDKPLADFLNFVRIVVAAINKALTGIPRDQVRLHVCWGNYEGPHDVDVPLEDIWPDVSQINAGAVLLSLANPRHAHEYRLFADPAFLEDRVLIPGVIETTTNYVEHPEVVADRIERIVQMVGDPQRIIAGPDCGFETAAGSKMVVEEVVWAKLRSLSQGAAIASKRVFG
jgi:5-methyltetrahydropteroyltriglutamate--homocysteine methyltransferase